MSVNMREMLEAGVHFGHRTRFWHPQMAPYIFGHRHKIHIINLEITVQRLIEAQAFVRRLVANRGTLLFVGTKRQAGNIVREEASRAQMPYVDQRWLGGMMTNFKTVKQSIKRLTEMETMFEDSQQLETLSKKERLTYQRDVSKLQKSIGGIRSLDGLPDAIFVIDVGYHRIAIEEAKKLGIPVVGVVDSNHSPSDIDYVIPGNDDSRRAVRIFARAIADAVLEGRHQSTEEVIAAIKEDEFTDVTDADTTTVQDE